MAVATCRQVTKLCQKTVITQSVIKIADLFDFRKALDLVPRDYLLLKMLRLCIGGKVYNVIKRMYESCLSKINLRNGLTEQERRFLKSFTI